MITFEIVSNIFNTIEEKVFHRDKDNSINIFLCGSNPENRDSLRYKIYSRIKDYPKFNIVFPEWLFSDLLVDKEHNLLKLEQDLAENVDVVVLPIEGIGTIAELGAFTSFPELTKKILVVNDEKYKFGKSFINLGPIALIKQYNKKNIFYYNNSSIDETVDAVCTRLIYYRSVVPKTDISKIFNLSRFLLYIIAIFQPITKNEIREYINTWNNSIKPYYIEPCLEILTKKQFIKMDYSGYDELYALSDDGHEYVYEVLFHNLNIVKEFSKIRAYILRIHTKRKKKFNVQREREIILELR